MIKLLKQTIEFYSQSLIIRIISPLESYFRGARRIVAGRSTTLGVLFSDYFSLEYGLDL